MHRARSTAVLAAGALILASALVAPNASARPEPAEGAAETYSNGVDGWRVFAPAAAFAPDGGYFLAWETEKAGLIGRRFDAEGKPSGDVLTLVPNDLPTTHPYKGPGAVQKAPELVSLGTDGFLLVWNLEVLDLEVDIFQQEKDLVGSRIFALRLDGKGNAVGEPFAVSPGEKAERAPDAVVLDDGSVVVTWESVPLPRVAPDGTEGVWARRLSPRIALEGEAFRIDDREKQAGGRPAVAASGPHGFVVAWEGCCDRAGDRGVFVRRYESGATPAGPGIEVPATSEGAQQRPAIARHGDDGFLVAWLGPVTGNERDTAVVARRLGPDLAPRGDDLALAEALGRPDAALALTAGDAGYLAAWAPVGSATVYGRHVDPEGRTAGSAVTLSQHPVGIQWRLALASDGHDRFLGAWESFSDEDKPAIASRLLVLVAEEPAVESSQSPR